jgi:hypothetical protein
VAWVVVVSEKCRQYIVRVGDKQIFITPEVLQVVHTYLHRPMSLEELARSLGLEGWEEAYEFIKRIPAWIMWMPVSLWKLRLEKEGCLELFESAKAGEEAS